MTIPTIIRQGDTVSLTRARRDPASQAEYTERLFARVSWTELLADGRTYFGYRPVSPPRGSWGLSPGQACAWGAQKTGGRTKVEVVSSSKRT